MSTPTFKTLFPEFVDLIVDAKKHVAAGKSPYKNESGNQVNLSKATWEPHVKNIIANLDEESFDFESIRKSFIKLFNDHKDKLLNYDIDDEGDFDWNLDWLLPESSAKKQSIPGRRGINLVIKRDEDNKILELIPLSEIYKTCVILDDNACVFKYGRTTSTYLFGFMEKFVKCIKISLIDEGRNDEASLFDNLTKAIYNRHDYFTENPAIAGELAGNGISEITKLVESTGITKLGGEGGLTLDSIKDLMGNDKVKDMISSGDLKTIGENLANLDNLKELTNILQDSKVKNALPTPDSHLQE